MQQPVALPDAKQSQAAVALGMISSETGNGKHRIVLDFKTLEDMQNARDAILTIRRRVQSGEV
jgi:hypothetical protein